MGTRMGARDSTFPPRAPGEVVSAAATVDARRAVKAKHIVTASRPRAELFSIARDWVAKLPDMELVNEIANELIAWKTVGNSPLRHAGSVNLHETGRGSTEVKIEIDYEPANVPFGALFDDLTQRLLAST